MPSARLTMSCLVILALTGSATAAELELPNTIVQAVKVYRDSIVSAEKKLSTDFVAISKRIQNLPGKGDLRAQAVELIDKERIRFEKEHLIPFSAPMQDACGDYLGVLFRSQLRLIKAYDEVIDLKLRQGKTDEVKALRASMTQTLNIRVIAKWRHRPGRFVVLFSNGRINDPNGKNSWIIAKRSLLLRWVNPEAPGGAWVDKCKISVDGKTYNGTNQQGATISGWYIE